MDLQDNNKTSIKVSFDISTAISSNALSVVETAVKGCLKKKQVLVTELDLFVSALDMSSYKEMVDQTGWKVLQQQAEAIRSLFNRSFSGDVFLSPEAKLLLLNAYAIKKGDVVDIDDLLTAGIRTNRIVKAIRVLENLIKVAEVIYTDNNKKPMINKVLGESSMGRPTSNIGDIKGGLFGEPHDLLWVIKVIRKAKSK